MKRTRLQPQALSSALDRPTRISIFKLFLKFFVYCMLMRRMTYKTHKTPSPDAFTTPPYSRLLESRGATILSPRSTEVSRRPWRQCYEMVHWCEHLGLSRILKVVLSPSEMGLVRAQHCAACLELHWGAIILLTSCMSTTARNLNASSDRAAILRRIVFGRHCIL